MKTLSSTEKVNFANTLLKTLRTKYPQYVLILQDNSLLIKITKETAEKNGRYVFYISEETLVKDFLENTLSTKELKFYYLTSLHYALIFNSVNPLNWLNGVLASDKLLIDLKML